MDTSFPLSQTRCYQQAAKLMSKGASLSVALRGCLRARGSQASAARTTPETQASAEGTPGRAAAT